MSYRMFGIALGLALLVAGHSCPVWALTLDQAVGRALEHAPAIRAARAEREAGAEDVARARAFLLPYIRATGDLVRLRQDYRWDAGLAFPLPGRVDLTERKLSVELVQPLFRWDRWAGLMQGRLADQAAGVGLELARQGLILEVAGRLGEWHAASAQLQAARARLAAIQKLAAMSRARMDAGLATITEVLEAESRQRMAEAEVLDAERQASLARERLASLMGADPESLDENVELPDWLLVPIDPDDPAHWETRAEQQAPAVRLARLKAEMAEEAVEQSRGQALPALDLVAGYTRDTTTNGLFGAGSTRTDRMVGLRLEVPVFAGGGTWAQLRKAKKQKLAAGFRVEDAERSARLAAREAVLQWRTAARRLSALRAAVAAADKAREAAHTSYEAGLAGIVEVLDAESRLAEAKGGLAAAESALMLARLQLEAAVGELDAFVGPLAQASGSSQTERQ